MSLREALSRGFERCECAINQIRFAAEIRPQDLKPDGRWPDLRTQCLWTLIDCGQVAPAVQSGLLPPLLVAVLLDQYPLGKRRWWRYRDSRRRIEQYEEAVMCSAVIYRNEIHRAMSAKELRELPADVEHVQIPQWEGSAKVDVRDLERFPMLFSLHLDDHGIGVKEARSLAESSSLRSLTSLNLVLNGIGVEGMRVLAASGCVRSLTSLDLGYNQIDAEGVRALAESSCLRSLTSLDLERNQICDAGARALAESSCLRSLTSLYLGWNEIGDAGARALAESSCLRSLTSLNLGG